MDIQVAELAQEAQLAGSIFKVAQLAELHHFDSSILFVVLEKLEFEEKIDEEPVPKVSIGEHDESISRLTQRRRRREGEGNRRRKVRPRKRTTATTSMASEPVNAAPVKEEAASSSRESSASNHNENSALLPVSRQQSQISETASGR